VGGEERDDAVAGLLFLSFPLAHFYSEEFTRGPRQAAGMQRAWMLQTAWCCPGSGQMSFSFLHMGRQVLESKDRLTLLF